MAIWTNWDPLEEAIVGDCYSPGDLDWAVAPEIKDSVNVILKETREDLNHLANLLISLGVKVHRPRVVSYQQPVDLTLFTAEIPSAPIVPRDQYLAYGDIIYQTYTSLTDRYFDSLAFYEIFRGLFDQGYNWLSAPPPILDQNLTHTTDGPYRYKELHDQLLWHTATMFKCGDALIVNNLGPGNARGLDWFKRNTPNTRFIENNNTNMKNWGHIDHGFFMTDDETVFCKDLHWIPECLKNKQIFNVGCVPEDKVYQQLSDRWAEQHPHLGGKFSAKRIDKWLNQWMGYAQKVQFDTNVLVVDSKNVIFSNNVPQKLFELLDKQGITSHVSMQRHGYLWQGGVHCFTLDLKRRGQRRSIIK
jgi:glycine amidinotransferase